ncbi:MAG: hypothetical protein K5675_10075 [Lachnospiraceae bacterium]|nr:hypothetical protein [Lachnospiraceae bacterium]
MLVGVSQQRNSFAFRYRFMLMSFRWATATAVAAQINKRRPITLQSSVITKTKMAVPENLRFPTCHVLFFPGNLRFTAAKLIRIPLSLHAHIFSLGHCHGSGQNVSHYFSFTAAKLIRIPLSLHAHVFSLGHCRGSDPNVSHYTSFTAAKLIRIPLSLHAHVFSLGHCHGSGLSKNKRSRLGKLAFPRLLLLFFTVKLPFGRGCFFSHDFPI